MTSASTRSRRRQYDRHAGMAIMVVQAASEMTAAALFGLRLAIRSLGCQPEVDLFPDPSQRHLLARVRAGRPEPMMSDERAMLQAVPHRHTHRGAFEPGPLPGGLLAWLQDDAIAEGARRRPSQAFVEYFSTKGGSCALGASVGNRLSNTATS